MKAEDLDKLEAEVLAGLQKRAKDADACTANDSAKILLDYVERRRMQLTIAANTRLQAKAQQAALGELG